MYRMLKGEVVLATVTNPVWVKKQDNGSYGLCSEQEAQGVVIEGTVYHVEGRDELDGTESVVVTEISEDCLPERAGGNHTEKSGAGGSRRYCGGD